jgi:hypothetical protein
MSNSTLPLIANRFEGAADKVREAAANVGDAANRAVTTAGDMATDAGCAVGSMASQAACQVGQTADDLTARAGAGIKGLGDKLSHNAPHSGIMGSASQSVARSVHEGGQYVQDAKLSGMVEDVAQMIRRNPLPAVFIAIGLGWFVARKMRS